ncbi:MAG TPA: ribulose-phosphate 3-epimerase [Vicinamibacterales bacterium]|jgi:ribulose-phosphate 3-epimerase|nr:ribulose-phosphate 3-epimerase [Vicinamibacterales bacterium]
MSVRLAPSILASDFGHLADAVHQVEVGGADLIHVDVMDGHFVPNLTLGPAVTAAVKRATSLPLDVHLMIEDPDRYLDAFVEAGAAMISVHVEVLPHLHRTLTRIRELGVKAGAAINPSTPVAAIGEVVDRLDHVLVMSVNPGFSGQTFIPHTLDKIREVRALLDAGGSRAAIEVDGGIEIDNAASIVAAGASILVAGSSIFGTSDPAEATRALRRAAEGRPRQS